VIAHLKDVSPLGAEAGSPSFGTGAFEQAPYLRFLRERRPDLPLILEHLRLEEVPLAITSVRAVAASLTEGSDPGTYAAEPRLTERPPVALRLSSHAGAEVEHP